MPSSPPTTASPTPPARPRRASATRPTGSASRRPSTRSVVTVLGRLGHEANPNPKGRNRLVLSSAARGVERRADAWWWNPAEAPLAEALAAAAPQGGIVAVPGGMRVFDLFLAAGYDAFHLTRVASVLVPDGTPVFSAVRDGRTRRRPPRRPAASTRTATGDARSGGPTSSLTVWRAERPDGAGLTDRAVTPDSRGEREGPDRMDVRGILNSTAFFNVVLDAEQLDALASGGEGGAFRPARRDRPRARPREVDVRPRRGQGHGVGSHPGRRQGRGHPRSGRRGRRDVAVHRRAAERHRHRRAARSPRSRSPRRRWRRSSPPPRSWSSASPPWSSSAMPSS